MGSLFHAVGGQVNAMAHSPHRMIAPRLIGMALAFVMATVFVRRRR